MNADTSVQHSPMADSTSSSGHTPEARTPKRIVTSRACDSCRTRRIRCLFSDDASDKSQTCKACSETSKRCTFDLLNKRRGPPAKWRTSSVQSLAKKSAYDLAHEVNIFCGKSVVDFLVQNFLDYLYPLTPIIHAPSFIAGVKDNRQSRDLKFFFLLISVLVATACTLPETFGRCKEIDASFRFATRKDMLEAGVQLTLQLRQPDYFDDLTLDQMACSFMLMFAYAQQGLLRRSIMYHSEVTMIIHQMELHLVGTYNTLNKIQQQICKKALWMNFTTESHLKLHFMQTEYMHMELAHLGSESSVLLPFEVDDEFITETEVGPQPKDRLSLVAGLNALTAINKTWMESNTTTSAKSSHSHHQPSEASGDPGKHLGTCECGCEVSLAGPLSVAHERLHKLEHALDDLPPELAFERTNDTLERLAQFPAMLQSQYDTIRVNVHVTHLWAQNALVELIIALSENDMHSSAFLETKKHCMKFQEDIARRLLKFLDTLPKFNILPNGFVMVVKIRSVGASILQERTPTGSSSDNDLDDLVRSFATLLAGLDHEHGPNLSPGFV